MTMKSRWTSLCGAAAILLIGAGVSPAQDEILAPAPAEPQTLGTSAAELVYTPVTPCRIINTLLAGGAIAAGGTRSFRVTGTNFSAQGGSSGNCNVPVGATGAVINFVAVNPAGAGDLRFTPFGTSMPLASFLNYVASGIPNDNTANGMTFPICDPSATTCTSDFTIQADAAATQLVADVQGYFRRPTNVVNVLWNDSSFGAQDIDATPVLCQTGDVTTTFNERAVLNGTVCLQSAAAGLMGFYLRPVYSLNSGTTWTGFVTNFTRAGDIDNNAWNCASHHARVDVGSGVTIRYGLQIGRDTGTADAVDTRCSNLVERFSR